MQKYFVLVVICFFFPSVTEAKVIISEIAWMGSSNSANDEWIELYNSGDETVSLNNWKLEAVDGTPKINLLGEITAQGYFLLERSVETAVPGIQSDLIFSGSLGNSGETLKLFDATSTLIDSVENSSGWSAGDNTTKQTMQRYGSVWVTASSTSKATTTAPLDTEDEDSTVIPTNTENTHTNTEQITTSVFIPSEVKEFQVGIGRKRIVPVGNDIYLKSELVKLQGAQKESVRYIWTLGDGTTKEGKDIHHAYLYPGEYIVILNAYVGDKAATARTEISVFKPEIEITEISEDSLTLKNNSSVETNITAWRLQNQEGVSFLFPIDTILQKNKSLTLHKKTIQLGEHTQKIDLLDQQGEIVASVQKTQPDPHAYEIETDVTSQAEIISEQEEHNIEIIPQTTLKKEELKTKTERKDHLEKIERVGPSEIQAASVVLYDQEKKETSSRSKLLSFPVWIVDAFLKLIE